MAISYNCLWGSFEQYERGEEEKMMWVCVINTEEVLFHSFLYFLLFWFWFSFDLDGLITHSDRPKFQNSSVKLTVLCETSSDRRKVFPKAKRSRVPCVALRSRSMAVPLKTRDNFLHRRKTENESYIGRMRYGETSGKKENVYR